MNEKTQPTAAQTGMSDNNAVPMDRRTFIGGVATVAGLSIVPARVLGGPNHVAPSDKINLAYIGLGTQGLREMPRLLELEDVQVTAVCDPQKKSIDYFDWDPRSLLNSVRETVGDPNWTTGGNNTIPGGLENGKAMVDGYYRHHRQITNYNCKAYTDFRELFAKEKDIDAVKIMTPDHLHGVIAMAAIKRGIATSTHKPLSNRLLEGKKVIDMAKKTDVVTYFIPWASNGSMAQIMVWINGGVIGQLKEVHNWSYRPVWPQYAHIPTDSPKIPEGFDWDLWLGPEAERPYHPHYTNMVFRGWYDFGGGSMADMGHYSLWTVFNALQLEKPTIIEPNRSHVCDIRDNTSAYKINNDFAFPFACTVRFKYPANEIRGAVDLVWYDGGMRPPTPDAFYQKGEEFPEEGMMFVGDKGIIMTSDFRVRDPYILAGDMALAKEIVEEESEGPRGMARFIEGIKMKKQIEGSFRDAWPITEAVNLYAVALRRNKTLTYDAANLNITNDEQANAYLDRTYRQGWALEDM